MNDEDTFRSIVTKLRDTAHGSQYLGELSAFARGLKSRRQGFFADRLLQRAVLWDENKERGIWPNAQIAEQNQYWFLQGYLIRSQHVRGPGGHEDHTTWLVLAVDCDCVRAPYVGVAKVVLIGDDEPDKQALALASSFKTTKLFPIPPYEGNDRWGLADLETPFYLERAYVPFAVPLQSLTVDGWHILNAVLQHRYTRAVDISESERLRLCTP